MRKPIFAVSEQVRQKRPVQLQKMNIGLKCLIQEVEGLSYLCRENKGAHLLRVHLAADKHLCFRYIVRTILYFSNPKFQASI